MTTVSEMTPKQQRVLQCVEEYWQEHQVPPSIADIAQVLGVTRATAYEHLNALKRKGLLGHLEGVGRSWRPTRSPALIPLLGQVSAGQPILAVEQVQDYLPAASNHSGESLFALRVRGDSMIGAHIQDGDVVIVRVQSTAQNGEIVVALVEDEATVKKFERVGDRVRLIAMNPNYAPIELSSRKLIILGLVVEVRRKLCRTHLC